MGQKRVNSRKQHKLISDGRIPLVGHINVLNETIFE